MIVVKDRVVAIEYELKDELGNVLDSNKGFEPLEYLHGHGNIVLGLEKALTGLSINEYKTVIVPPELGYGIYENTLRYQLPLTDYLHTGFTNIDDVIQLPDGREAVIISKDDFFLNADANHTLAGKTLYYDVSVKNVREATNEEMSCGYPLEDAINCSGLPGCC